MCKYPRMTLTHTKDIDGDAMISVEVGDLTAFAVQQMSGVWALNFGLTAEMGGCDWMDTLTGRGAFSTIRMIRPALEAIVAAVGDAWIIYCDARRARLYSRYVSADRIRII